MIDHDSVTAFFKYMITNHKGDNPLRRTLMSSTEIKLAEFLVKGKLLIKGTAVEDGRMKIYYYEEQDRHMFDNLREIGFFSKKLQ